MSRLGHVVLVGILCLLVLMPVAAQDGGVRTLQYNDFAVSYPSDFALTALVTSYSATSEGMFPSPSYDRIVLFPAEATENIWTDGRAMIWLYPIAEMAEYPFVQEEYFTLQTLLTDRPDLADYMTSRQVTLPVLPQRNAAQVLRARAEYIDLPTISGVAFVAAYFQNMVPFASSDFAYYFQGISHDGQYYVAAYFPLVTDVFGAERDFANHDFTEDAEAITAYILASTDTLNAASDDQFTPSISSLQAIISTFSFVGEVNLAE